MRVCTRDEAIDRADDILEERVEAEATLSMSLRGYQGLFGSSLPEYKSCNGRLRLLNTVEVSLPSEKVQVAVGPLSREHSVCRTYALRPASSACAES